MRTVLFLLLPFLASGQIYIDSYKFQGAAANLLLDDYPGAAAAYSLRLLDKDYTGDCITVRRSSDNALDTFGFVNNYLDTTSLKSFCGTGGTDSCFVRIWWDQSGNGNNIEKSTNTSQPLLLKNGALITTNTNLPEIEFSGSTDNLSRTGLSEISKNNNFAIVSVLRINAVSNSALLLNQALASSDRIGISAAASYSIYNGTSYVGKSYSITTAQYILFAENSPQELYVNSNISSGTTTTSLINNTNLSIGGRPDDNIGANANCNYSELIIYGSNQSSNRTGIESNINSFYSIY